MPATFCHARHVRAHVLVLERAACVLASFTGCPCHHKDVPKRCPGGTPTGFIGWHVLQPVSGCTIYDVQEDIQEDIQEDRTCVRVCLVRPLSGAALTLNGATTK